MLTVLAVIAVGNHRRVTAILARASAAWAEGSTKLTSSIRLLTRAVLVGEDRVARILATSQKGIEIMRGQLASDKGLGHGLIEKFLEGVPRITSYVVQQQLATLKASGDYHRIVTEVTQEIEAEQKECRVAAYRHKHLQCPLLTSRRNVASR